MSFDEGVDQLVEDGACAEQREAESGRDYIDVFAFVGGEFWHALCFGEMIFILVSSGPDGGDFFHELEVVVVEVDVGCPGLPVRVVVSMYYKTRIERQRSYGLVAWKVLPWSSKIVFVDANAL